MTEETQEKHIDQQFEARKETIGELAIYLVKLDLEELRDNTAEEVVDRFFQQKYKKANNKPFELTGE